MYSREERAQEKEKWRRDVIKSNEAKIGYFSLAWKA